jgi:Cdc6-like AAA superfamily ATPase
MRFNPFNPQQPARPDFFVGRAEELEKFEQNLLQTIHDSPMNMAITGNRGIGKTSTLIKFEEIAKRHNCLVVRLSN